MLSPFQKEYYYVVVPYIRLMGVRERWDRLRNRVATGGHLLSLHV
jgi:predicted ABC-type ATPase